MSDLSFAESIDRMKESFLWAAAQGGNTQDCASLIDIGANINWRNTEGETPLLAATRRGHKETISYLLAHGADSNIPGNDSFAPIHICARRGDVDCLDLLLNANTSTTLMTKDGMTALDIAKSKGHESIYARLMQQRSLRPTNRPNNNNNLNNTSTSLPSTSPVLLPPSITLSTKSDTKGTTSLDTKLTPISRTTSKELPSLPKSEGKTLLTPANNLNNLTSTPTNTTPLNHITLPVNGYHNQIEEQIYLLRNSLDGEKVARKIVETKLEVFANQNKELIDEYNKLSKEKQQLQMILQPMESKQAIFLGEKLAIDKLTIEECDKYLDIMKKTSEKLELRKKIVLENQKESLLCVICQERSKSVVLLPCRHLCLCQICSNHRGLDNCPLCRELIVDKFVVYS